MSGEKRAKGWRFYGLVGFGAIALLSAGVWALQYAGSGPEKTLSPLVVHNNLQIDLNEPDLFLDSDSLSQLPKDLLTIPFLRDVLSEDFVFYYQNHADRLGIEGSIRRIVYEHDLTLKDKLFSSLLDQPAQAALWHDKQGHLSHYIVLIQRSGLSKLLEPLLFAATSDSQLSKTEISSITINNETIPVYQLRYNGNNSLLFTHYQDKMLVFSSTDMLFKGDQQDTEATAIASDLLSGKKRWEASFGLEDRLQSSAEKPLVRQRIVVSANLLGLGYQRLIPSFAGVRFEMSNDGWRSFLALNDESASVDASFDFTPVWRSMPAGASFCVALPYSHGIAEEMLSHISQENDKLSGMLDGAAGLCWYEDSRLQTPLFVGQFDGAAEQAQLPGKLFTQTIGALESKAPEGVLPVTQTQQGDAQIWRREVSSRYGQYPIAQAAQPEQLMSDYFFRVSLAMQNKTLLFSLDDTLVNNALQTLNKTRPAMVDVIPADGVIPVYINPQGVAKLLRNETLASLPKNLEPVFYNAAQTLLMPKLGALSQQPRYAMKLVKMEPGAAWQWLPVSWQPL
ncbi:DUF2138 domain-containing protein [Escherichia albertii]|uniref:DUF2138 domain-containing protein n=1 Tax=Escherichia albertii TaxID=208962 RepID=UPI0011ED9584|nr:DUF2138 domain-containing protein [Escherichia albertii]